MGTLLGPRVFSFRRSLTVSNRGIFGPGAFPIQYRREQRSGHTVRLQEASQPLGETGVLGLFLQSPLNPGTIPVI